MSNGGRSSELSLWVKHQLLVFHTWRCKCEGVSRDSGFGHEESHLMHDIRSFNVSISFVRNVNGCLGAILCAFRWGVTLVGKFNY